MTRIHWQLYPIHFQLVKDLKDFWVTFCDGLFFFFFFCTCQFAPLTLFDKFKQKPHLDKLRNCFTKSKKVMLGGLGMCAKDSKDEKNIYYKSRFRDLYLLLFLPICKKHLLRLLTLLRKSMAFFVQYHCLHISNCQIS